jgi:histidine triad (HIT) family protein
MVSHAPPDYDCPFCRYIGGEGNEFVDPDHEVERTPDVLAFVSPTWWPNNPGNVLVIPTSHIENLYELPDELGTPLQRTVRRVAIAMKNAYGCDGVSTRQHNEPAGNQDVWHFHTHVFPRWQGDNLYRERGSRASKPEMSRVAEDLRLALNDVGVGPLAGG